MSERRLILTRLAGRQGVLWSPSRLGRALHRRTFGRLRGLSFRMLRSVVFSGPARYATRKVLPVAVSGLIRRRHLLVDVVAQVADGFRVAGQPDSAAAGYRIAVALAPERADLLRRLGEQLIAAGQPAEAEATFRRLLALAPDDGDAGVALGTLLLDRGGFDEAADVFERAGRSRPLPAAPLRALADHYVRKGEPARAMAQLAAVAQQWPADARAALELAELQFEACAYAAGASILDRALAALPGGAGDAAAVGLLMKLAYARLGQNDLDGAAALYEQVSQLEPHNTEARNRLGAVRFQQGRLDDVLAINDFNIAMEPSFWPAYQNICLMLLRRGDLTRFWDWYHRLIAKAAPHDEARINLQFFADIVTYLAGFDVPADKLRHRFAHPDTGKKKRFVFALTAFGEDYIRDLVEICVPSLLAPGNMREWCERTDSSFMIFTTEGQVERLRKDPAIRRLGAILPVHVVGFPDHLPQIAIHGMRYYVSNTMQAIAIRVAKAANAGIVFMAPDVIHSENYFNAIYDAVAGGKEIVFYYHQRLEKRNIYAHPAIRSARAEDGTLSVPAAVLNKVAMPNLPPFFDEMFYYNGGVMAAWPAYLCWRLPDGGMIVHGFAHHPLLFSADAISHYEGHFFFSNDSEFLKFVPRYDPGLTRCHTLTDTTDAVAFELSDIPVQPPARTAMPRSRHDRIALFGTVLSDMHRWFLDKKVVYRLAATATSSDEFRQSDTVVADIAARMAALESQHGKRPYAAGYCPYMGCGFP